VIYKVKRFRASEGELSLLTGIIVAESNDPTEARHLAQALEEVEQPMSPFLYGVWDDRECIWDPREALEK